MLVIGPDRRIRQVNPAAARELQHFGLQPGDAMAKLADAVYSAESGENVVVDDRPLGRALRGEFVDREKFTVRDVERGDPHRMVLSARPIMLDDNGTMGALLVWHDVTDDWDFAERTRIELARMGELLEGASDYAIIMLDPAGRVRSWSAAAERMQGFTYDQAIGQPYAAFFELDQRIAGVPEQILRDAVEQGKTQVEGKRLRADGSLFWAHAALTAMRDENNELRGFVKVTHDVSERRATECAVVELNELLEQRVAERTVRLEQQAVDLVAMNAELEAFSYSVSHDLRAPLRAMSGFARLIEQDFGAQLPDQAMHYVKRVTENAQQMGSLIDALLSFSRMQRQSLQSAPIDMTLLVQECWTALAPARGDRRIEFSVQQLPPATGDRQLIRQVWLNLLDNAIKYTCHQDVARVDVAAEVSAEAAAETGTTYLVRDNGAGFDMKYVERIGQVFQRLHHSEDFPGVGIGLALVQRIVQRHGGKLTAVGEPGVGASFGFTLCVKDPA